MKLFLEGKKYLLMRSLIMKASLKTLVRLAQFHMSCNITDNAMPFLLCFRFGHNCTKHKPLL